MQTHLIVYRDANFDVHFIEINPVTARLMQLILEDNNQSGQFCCNKWPQELNHPQPNIVIRGGIEILNDLRKRQSDDLGG